MSDLTTHLRPTQLSDVVGHPHIHSQHSPVAHLMRDPHNAPSVIIFGPPGVGKTSLARIIMAHSGVETHALSATNSGVKEIRGYIEHATVDDPVMLFIDEIHRLTSTQQDILLPAMEDGRVKIIGATTENPSFSTTPALRSRALVVELHPIDQRVITDYLTSPTVTTTAGVSITEGAARDIARIAGGDLRRALTIVSTLAASGATIDEAAVATIDGSVSADYDKGGDAHYDVTSAWIKAMRGSDPDAALHWLAKMIEGGEDPRFISRRLTIHASEDVGMADPYLMSIITGAQYAAHHIGFPEARIPLAHATVAIALAPKSNAIIRAINTALDDVRHRRTGSVPTHLKDAHFSDAADYGRGVGYLYPHDFASGLVTQDYSPVGYPITRGTYYQPTTHGFERTLARRLALINTIAGGGTP